MQDEIVNNIDFSYENEIYQCRLVLVYMLIVMANGDEDCVSS